MLGRIARIGILVGCIAYAFWDVDFPQLGQALAGYDPTKLLAVLLLTAIPYLAMACRLTSLLRGTANEPRFSISVIASVFALGMNNILPARLGELGKIIYLRQRSGEGSGVLTGAVFWERFTDVHALLALSLVTMVGLGRTQEVIPLLLMVGGGWLGLILLRMQPRVFARIARWLPGERLQQLAHDTMDSLRRGLSPSVALSVIGWTIVVWVFYALHVFLVIEWIAGISLTPPQMLLVVIGVALGATLPISPGALGIYEAIFVLLLGWFGVAPEPALAAALTAHMLQYVPTTLVAGIVLARTDMSFATMRTWGRQRPSESGQPGT